MRILVITHRFPYPPDKGDRIRGFSWLESLAGEYRVDLLTFTDKTVDDSLIDQLIQKTGIENVFTIRQSKASQSIYGLKSIVNGFSLTEGYFYHPRFEHQLKTLLNENDYDACLAVCSSVGSYFLRVAPKCRTIVDFVDVDSYKWAIYSERFRGFRKRFYLREADKVALLERQLIASADDVVVITPMEAQKLEFADVKVIANPVKKYEDALPAATDITRIVFIGQMDYFPNVDTVCWFAENIWPAIHKRYPHLKFMIVGRNPSHRVRKLGRSKSVVVTGQVEDVNEYLKSAISVIPLRMVCGLQNKLIQSLASGKPVIATSNVAHSAGFDDGEGLLIADSVDEWVNAITRLMEDRSLSYYLSQQGQELVTQRFAKEKIYSQMRKLVLPEVNESRRMALVC